MPELPEVETTRLGILPYCQNTRILQTTIRNAKLRWPVDPSISAKIKDQKILDVARRGKYLILHFKSGSLLWHLGMSGSIRVLKQKTPPEKHDHIDLTLDNGHTLRYTDPRRFGAFLWTEGNIEQHALINHLGPEPLSDNFSFEYLYPCSRKKKQNVKSWIMDSKVVVGVGNIYANESLFIASIHPLKPAGKLTKNQISTLVETIKIVLEKAIQRGGTTLKDFTGSDGKPGYFKQELKVYGKSGEPCPNCHKPLTEKHLQQRSTVYCTHCQN